MLDSSEIAVLSAEYRSLNAFCVSIMLDCYRSNAKLKENHTIRRSLSDVESRGVRVPIPYGFVP